MKHYHIFSMLNAFLLYLYYGVTIFIYITMCLYIIISIILCVFSIYISWLDIIPSLLYANHATCLYKFVFTIVYFVYILFLFNILS